MKLDRLNQFLLITLIVLSGLTALRIYQSSLPPAPLWTLPPVDAEAARAIVVSDPSGSLRVEREGDGWVVTEPVRVPADADKIQGLLRDWSTEFTPDLKLEDRVADDALTRYGLTAAERRTLRIEGPDGALVDLELGASVSGGSNYLRRADDDAVYRGRAPGAWRVKSDLSGWRDLNLFSFDKDDLSGLGITNASGSFRFRREESPERAWWIGELPADFTPSSRVLDNLGRSLARLKAQRILEGDEAASARPAAKLDTGVAVWIRTEDGAERTLRFGGELPEGGGTWAAIDGDERLFVLSAGAAGAFDKSLDDLRDKTVLRLERDPSSRVTWREGDHEVVVVPADEHAWRVERPEGWQVDDQKLNLALNSLLNLQAVDVLGDADAGIGPDSPSVTVEGPAGTTVLRIGATVDGGKVQARVDGRGEAFTLRELIVKRLRDALGKR